MKRILIVDDKDQNLYYLRALLEGTGFTVESAHHGAEALAKARQGPPDAIISDLLMPVMDGYTLLRHWKADTRLATIPFIVYTATYTEPEDERLAMSLGADAFILKPCEPEEFVRRLREVGTKKGSASPAVPARPAADDPELLKVYSETLIRKLEEKTLQLEEVNRVLQQDIKERKLTEEKLRESEERFRGTFEQAAVGIAHLDTAGRFLRVNDRLCAITGFSREALLERTLLDVVSPGSREEIERARLALVEGRIDGHSVEAQCIRGDAGRYWTSIVSTLLRDPAGEPKYFITVFTDVTERRALQEQLLRAQRIESIGTLAGGIAHDLNNLLAPIVMGISLLRSEESAEDREKVIEMMERSAQRGTNLVKQVLSFARGVEGARVTVHLSHVVGEIHQFVRSTFPKNIAFRPIVSKDAWLILGDPTQLNQVMLNLCVNARDAMPDGGTITVTVGNIEIDSQYAAMLQNIQPGRYVLLEVQDTGVGIDPSLRDRIFEPFFTSKEPGKGTGLGLSTVLGIVRSHGGGVAVESEPGRGSTFKVYLPAQPDSTLEVVPEAVAKDFPRGRGETILVVDDDTIVLPITVRTLKTFGYSVLEAEDGAHAVALYALRRGEIALVLTDLMMPVMDGPSLIRALQRINPAVKVIATSGLHGMDVQTGTRHFLAKPFTAGALLTLVRHVLELPDDAAMS